MLRKWWLVFLVLVFCSTAFAEDKDATKPAEKDQEPAKLQEIVVTATRTEKETENAPGKANVVTKKEIEKRKVDTVDSTLNTIPGVFDRRQSLMDTSSSISLNGIPDQKRTLILLDGIPINNAYDGGVSFSGLSLENIERVEVVQGPFSSLYGGHAMGGVVNVITKMPEKREFYFNGGYGESLDRGKSLDDFRKTYFSYGDRPYDGLSMFLSYGYKSTHGFPKDLNVQSSAPPAGITGWSLTTDNGTYGGQPRYLIGDRGSNQWWDDDMTIKMEYDFSKESKLRFSYIRTRYEYDYADPHTYLRDAAGNPVYSYGTVNQSSFVDGNGGKEDNIYNISYETEIGRVKTKLTSDSLMKQATGTRPPAQLLPRP